MKIVLTTPQQALEYWPTISPYLTRVIDHGLGESTITDYMAKILNYQAQCWVVLDEEKIVGVGLTQFLVYSQYKTLHILAFSGDDFDQQAKVFPTVVEFARANDCKAIEQYGRKGWAKVLPKYIPQFEESYTVMRYDLTTKE